jgi:hypothetical protein
VREEQGQNRKFDTCGEPGIYCGRSTMDNISSYVLYMPNCATYLVTSDNVMFGNKCLIAKDTLNVIDKKEVALDFLPEANVSEITASSIDSILHQTGTHYILQMSNASVKSMPKPLIVTSFVRAQNASWTQMNGCSINQILFLDEVYLLSPDMFFHAQTVRFTSTAKYIDPISHKDAMFRPDAQEWKEVFDKELN